MFPHSGIVSLDDEFSTRTTRTAKCRLARWQLDARFALNGGLPQGLCPLPVLTISPSSPTDPQPCTFRHVHYRRKTTSIGVSLPSQSMSVKMWAGKGGRYLLDSTSLCGGVSIGSFWASTKCSRASADVQNLSCERLNSPRPIQRPGTRVIRNNFATIGSVGASL